MMKKLLNITEIVTFPKSVWFSNCQIYRFKILKEQIENLNEDCVLPIIQLFRKFHIIRFFPIQFSHKLSTCVDHDLLLEKMSAYGVHGWRCHP